MNLVLLMILMIGSYSRMQSCKLWFRKSDDFDDFDAFDESGAFDDFVDFDDFDTFDESDAFDDFDDWVLFSNAKL